MISTPFLVTNSDIGRSFSLFGVVQSPYFSFLTASVYFWLPWVFTATHGLSLIVESGGYSLAAVHRLLVEVASFGAEHGL